MTFSGRKVIICLHHNSHLTYVSCRGVNLCLCAMSMCQFMPTCHICMSLFVYVSCTCVSFCPHIQVILILRPTTYRRGPRFHADHERTHLDWTRGTQLELQIGPTLAPLVDRDRPQPGRRRELICKKEPPRGSEPKTSITPCMVPTNRPPKPLC